MLSVAIDDGEPRSLRIDGVHLHVLAEHERHEAHHLTLSAEEGLRVWSVSFAAGLP